MVGSLPPSTLPHHGTRGVCAACPFISTMGEGPWSMRRGYQPPMGEGSGLCAEATTHHGRGPGLCAEASNPPWERGLVYAQRLLTHGRGPGLCAETSLLRENGTSLRNRPPILREKTPSLRNRPPNTLRRTGTPLRNRPPS